MAIRSRGSDFVNPKRYTGLSPQRVSKDAKYTVTAAGSIRLEYQESRRVRIMLTTEEHEKLARRSMSSSVTSPGAKGGAFYINEFYDVLVPDGEGGACFWAGTYDGLLEFRDGDLRVSPVPDDDIAPGDNWRGPHVGVPLRAHAAPRDVRYEVVDGRLAHHSLPVGFARRQGCARAGESLGPAQGIGRRPDLHQRAVALLRACRRGRRLGV